MSDAKFFNGKITAKRMDITVLTRVFRMFCNSLIDIIKCQSESMVDVIKSWMYKTSQSFRFIRKVHNLRFKPVEFSGFRCLGISQQRVFSSYVHGFIKTS
jgi:hypothetical protein